MSRSRLLSSPRSFLFSTGVTRPASGIMLGFKPMDEGENDWRDRASFFMVITDISERKIMLTFHNQAPVSCVISDIVFADGGLYSIGVQGARHSAVPGKLACTLDAGAGSCQYETGRYQAAGDQFADYRTVDPKAPQEGIRPGESLGIIFDLQAGITLADVISALSREKLNISLKLRCDTSGTTGLLINEPGLGLSPG